MHNYIREMDVVNEQEANTTSTSSLRDDSTRQPPPPSYDELDRQGQFDHRYVSFIFCIIGQ
jgi:hypothetical protein